MATVTRLGFGGPSAAYLGFVAKASEVVIYAEADITVQQHQILQLVEMCAFSQIVQQHPIGQLVQVETR